MPFLVILAYGLRRMATRSLCQPAFLFPPRHMFFSYFSFKPLFPKFDKNQILCYPLYKRGDKICVHIHLTYRSTTPMSVSFAYRQFSTP